MWAGWRSFSGAWTRRICFLERPKTASGRWFNPWRLPRIQAEGAEKWDALSEKPCNFVIPLWSFAKLVSVTGQLFQQNKVEIKLISNFKLWAHVLGPWSNWVIYIWRGIKLFTRHSNRLFARKRANKELKRRSLVSWRFSIFQNSDKKCHDSIE